jgi:hypothetical protein
MYYKVVAYDDDNNLRSSTVKDPAWYVDYQLNVPAKPIRRGSKLFVFNNLESVEEWIKETHFTLPWAVYECEVENPVITLVRSTFLISSDLVSFWNYYNDRFDILETGYTLLRKATLAPKDTYFVDSVTLTNLVGIVQADNCLR